MQKASEFMTDWGSSSGGGVKYAVAGLLGLLAVALAMFGLTGTMRLIALMVLSVLFSVIPLMRAAGCPRSVGCVLLALSTTLMAGVLSAVLVGRGCSVFAACTLGFSAPAAIAAMGIGAMTTRSKGLDSTAISGFGRDDIPSIGVGESTSWREGAWSDFLLGDAFKRVTFAFFALLILVLTLYGMMGAVVLVSAAAAAVLFIAVVAMGSENRRLRHGLVLVVLITVILGGVFSELLSRLGSPLFGASTLGFAGAGGIAWALHTVVMRRRLMQWGRGVELTVSGRGELSADQFQKVAGKSTTAKKEQRPIYAGRTTGLGTIYAVLGAIIVILIAMTFLLRRMAAEGTAAASSDSLQERVWMEAWLREIVDEAPENIRKMREADKQFRREVEAQRRRAGIRRDKRSPGGERPSLSLHAGENRSGPRQKWRSATGEIRPGVKLYSGRGQKKVLIGELLEVISTDASPQSSGDPTLLRVRLKRPDGAVEEVTLSPGDTFFVRQDID